VSSAQPGAPASADLAVVSVLRLQMAGGMLDGRRTLATLDRGGGAPNGVSVDDEGCLWVAIT
jgi:sugar lactone lactonase YvrE